MTKKQNKLVTLEEDGGGHHRVVESSGGGRSWDSVGRRLAGAATHHALSLPALDGGDDDEAQPLHSAVPTSSSSSSMTTTAAAPVSSTHSMPSASGQRRWNPSLLPAHFVYRSVRQTNLVFILLCSASSFYFYLLTHFFGNLQRRQLRVCVCVYYWFGSGVVPPMYTHTRI